MWQAPSQRARTQAKKREKTRKIFHLKRVQAEVKTVGGLGVPSTVTLARVILNDLTPKGIGLFTSSPMMVGQEIALTIEDPKRFYVRGRIVWCQEVANVNKVLSEHPFSYRIGIEFVVGSPEERQAIKTYCEELSRDYLYGNGLPAAA
jgi:Tfp pilus assembly protein PilZ